jgi:heterodisulfide reductase subunit A
MHEKTYRRMMTASELNPYLLEIANIREQCAWVNPDRLKATSKSKDLLRAAVVKVGSDVALEPEMIPVNPVTLVVGGGIAGITAALEIAEADHQVILVEKEPGIGGHMAQLDKTFPTLDCAACISTPKMSQIGQHPNVRLLTHSQVTNVTGHPGSFKVTIEKKPRYVKESDCKGCGDCATACPVIVPSEFDLGLGKRKAVYRQFPQSVPNVYTIDRRGISPCRSACPAGVNAQGYIALISQGKFTEALEIVRRTMPLSSVCGRVCHSPCEDNCARIQFDQAVAIRALKRFVADQELSTSLNDSNSSEPMSTDRIAIVGSGPAGLSCASDLADAGYQITVFEAADKPGGLLRYGIPAYRLPEAALDRDIAYIADKGIQIKTCSPVTSVTELEEQGFKAVFIAVGAWQNIKLDIQGEHADGVMFALDFLKQVRQGTPPAIGAKVGVIGGGNAAIDAARSAIRLGATTVRVIYRRTRAEMPAIEAEIVAAENEGVLFTFLSSPIEVLTAKSRATGLRCLRNTLGAPDKTGRAGISTVPDSEYDIELDTVIVAVGQAPDKLNFSEIARRNNGTIEVDDVTLETKNPGVFAGGDTVTGPSNVIEAVAAGKKAAESIKRFLQGNDMTTGRNVNPVTTTYQGMKPRHSARATVSHDIDLSNKFGEAEGPLTPEQAISEASRCLNCAVCSDCRQCVKVCEPGCIDFDQVAETIEITAGNIIVATGYDVFNPTPLSRYGYGKLDDIYTSLEFERLANASGPTNGRILLKNGNNPQSVAFVHCVGSRDKNYQDYCSQICCMYSLKHAHLVKERTGADVYQMYIDIRCVGKGYEEFYHRVAEEGINLIRGKVAEITEQTTGDEEQGQMIIIVEDTLSGQVLRIPVDMVVLAGAMIPQSDSSSTARLFGLSRSQDGFLLEQHPKMGPISTMNEGVYIAGCAQGPKDIPHTVVQAQAAAGRVLATIARGYLTQEPFISQVVDENCDGCAYCVDPCPYDAISLIEYRKNGETKKTVEADPMRCHGCGVCMATCPKQGITVRNFGTAQLGAMVDAIISA